MEDTKQKKKNKKSLNNNDLSNSLETNIIVNFNFSEHTGRMKNVLMCARRKNRQSEQMYKHERLYAKTSRRQLEGNGEGFKDSRRQKTTGTWLQKRPLIRGRALFNVV